MKKIVFAFALAVVAAAMVMPVLADHCAKKDEGKKDDAAATNKVVEAAADAE